MKIVSGGIQSQLRETWRKIGHTFSREETERLKSLVRQYEGEIGASNDTKGVSESLLTLKTAALFAESVDADHNVLAAILLYRYAGAGKLNATDAAMRGWGEDVSELVEGLKAIGRFNSSNIIVNQDNYRGLLLAMAGDIRVVIAMIVRCLALMREINNHEDEEWVRQKAFEANYLYAQLAHKLGLYKIKGELEDLSLKYTNREVYKTIAGKLNETKRARDAYVARFIEPVKAALEKAGLKFEIKGRPKSISSIWSKIQKQKTDLGGIYDLFAIRIILDTAPTIEEERRDCWNAFSIVTSMYTHNPSRMRNWISIPKSNGYESLHATMNGPEGKWVEVQIRTRRMDDVAEKGLAAHWRYKGAHADDSDVWMQNIREILETAAGGPMELVKNTKKDIYSKEVFVFTPKGDVHRLPMHSSVLDFAFGIHTALGRQCTGAVVNGRNVKISYRLQSGDTIEVLTSSSQTPKQDWLNFVVTSRARNRIRQSLDEAKIAKSKLGKELLERRARNRKIELDEPTLMKLVKKAGYKFVNDFYADLGNEKLDVSKVISDYNELIERSEGETTRISAQEFHIMPPEPEEEHRSMDAVIIGNNTVKGIKYKFPKCCSPIYGDDVFGFISLTGVINVHKTTCPNAAYIKKKYAERLINVRWSGAKGEFFQATLQVTGNDDIAIITNITSIISKEQGVTLRNITIDSHYGLFRGFLTLGIESLDQLKQVIKKIATVKGVKQVERM